MAPELRDETVQAAHCQLPPHERAMDKVAIDDVPVERNPLQAHDVRKPVSQELGTEHFASNYFELEPGDSFSGGLHRHQDQEEVFYVKEGQTTFEVGVDRETVAVRAGELVRFELICTDCGLFQG